MLLVCVFAYSGVLMVALGLCLEHDPVPECRHLGYGWYIVRCPNLFAWLMPLALSCVLVWALDSCFLHVPVSVFTAWVLLFALSSVRFQHLGFCFLHLPVY